MWMTPLNIVTSCIIIGMLILGVGSVIDKSIEGAVVPIPSPSVQPTVVTGLVEGLKIEDSQESVETAKVKPVSDPVIQCNFPHSGTLSLPQSKCHKMTDCEIESGKWQAVYQSDCDALHETQASEVTSKATVASKAVASPAPYKPSYTPYVSTYTPLPFKTSCRVGTQVYYLTLEECTEKLNSYIAEQNRKREEQAMLDAERAELEKQREEACNRAYAEWGIIKQRFWAGEGKNYSSSAEAVFELESRRQAYQAELLGAGCTNRVSL